MLFHCEMNSRPGAPRDRPASPNTETGTVVSATTASSGEIVNIMIATPIEQQHRREHLAQRLLQALRDVVDVVGDPAQQVAARLLVDVAERQRVDLVLDVGPQLDIERWIDPGEDVRRDGAEHPATAA